MASTRTPSANELAKDVVLVHTVQLKPMIKAQISGRMISSGISDVAIVSVYFEKTLVRDLVRQNPLPKHIYICINFYSYSTIGTNKNNMRIRMWTVVLLTTIRKARNYCLDVDHCWNEDHCQYHLVIDHCQTGNCCPDREHCQNGKQHSDDQDQWSA